MGSDPFSAAYEALGPRLGYLARRWYRHLTGRTTILEINVEFVNYCNLRCPLCSLDHAKPRHAITGQLLEKLLENLRRDSRFRDVRRLNLWSGGETLLHNDIVGLLGIIRDYKLRFGAEGKRFPVVRLVTNAVILRGELAPALVGAGALDEIRFSVDGGSRERFEQLRKGARWDGVASNIRSFVRLNEGTVKTGIICVVDSKRPLDTGWMSAEFRELLALVDRVEIRHPHNWRGEVQIQGYDEPFHDYCYFLFYSLVLLPSGDVGVCCEDLNGAGVIGNFAESDLFELYRSPKRRQLIRNLVTGRRGRSELCRDCRGAWPSPERIQVVSAKSAAASETAPRS